MKSCRETFLKETFKNGFKKKMGLSRELTGTHCEKITLVQYMNINRKNPAVFINSYDDDNYK